MKQKEAALRTKRAMADSLKKLACQKPFSKVTIQDIITDCDVNRKTFYYHFEDMYGLLRWTLAQEAINIVKQFELLAEYEEALNFVLDYLEKNQRFLKSIYHSLGQSELKKFFYRDFIDIVRAFVEETERTLNLSVEDEFKNFICNFYAEAIAGSILGQLDHSGNYDRRKIMQYTLTIMNSAIPNVLSEAMHLTD